MGWPKTGEDKLLDAYWRERSDGILYTEVGLCGAKGPWPGSTERRIDGVIARPAAEQERRSKQAFRRDVKGKRGWKSVELIEVKAALSEGVIGQALAAQWLFESQHGKPHGINVERNVVLYRHEDSAMKWVVSKLDGLTAERRDVGKKNARMLVRPHYRLRTADVSRLVAYRQSAPGRIVTQVPIAGPASGVKAWEGSAGTHVWFVRIVGDPLNAITVFEGREWFFKLARGRELELIVPRRALGRGAIGIAKAHALMLSEQYGLPEPRLAIVCNRGDGALQAAAEAHGIAVHIVGRFADAGAEDDEEEDG
jgi:hypothetical protein